MLVILAIELKLWYNSKLKQCLLHFNGGGCFSPFQPLPIWFVAKGANANIQNASKCYRG